MRAHLRDRQSSSKHEKHEPEEGVMTTVMWAEAEVAYRQEKLQRYAQYRTPKPVRTARSGWLARHLRRQDGRRVQTVSVARRA